MNDGCRARRPVVQRQREAATLWAKCITPAIGIVKGRVVVGSSEVARRSVWREVTGVEICC